jgi:hypothetical protein
MDLGELLDALEAGRSLLVWIASWHAGTADEALVEAWQAEPSALAMRRILGLVAEDDVLDSTPERLSAPEIRLIQPEPPSLVRLVRIARKVVQLHPATLGLHDFVRWGWWTAVCERARGEDPVAWAWRTSANPNVLAGLLQWAGWQEAYGAALGLSLPEAAGPYEAWCRETCASIRRLVPRGPVLGDLPDDEAACDDPSAIALARYLRRLVEAG